MAGATIRIEQICRDSGNVTAYRYRNAVAILTGIREHIIVASQICKAHRIEVNMFQTCTVKESRTPNCFQTFRQCDSRQSGTIGERIVTNGYHVLRQNQLRYAGENTERRVTYGFQVFRQSQFCQAGTFIEGHIADSLKAFRQCDLRQSAHAIESIVTYGHKSLRKQKAGDLCTVAIPGHIRSAAPVFHCSASGQMQVIGAVCIGI